MQYATKCSRRHCFYWASVASTSSSIGSIDAAYDAGDRVVCRGELPVQKRLGRTCGTEQYDLEHYAFVHLRVPSSDTGAANANYGLTRLSAPSLSRIVLVLLQCSHTCIRLAHSDQGSKYQRCILLGYCNTQARRLWCQLALSFRSVLPLQLIAECHRLFLPS